MCTVWLCGVCMYKRLSVVSGQLWEVNNKETCVSSFLPSLHSLYFLLELESCLSVRERMQVGD